MTAPKPAERMTDEEFGALKNPQPLKRITRGDRVYAEAIRARASEARLLRIIHTRLSMLRLLEGICSMSAEIKHETCDTQYPCDCFKSKAKENP